MSYNEAFGIGPVFYLSNRKNICFNKVAYCNRQSHFIVLYGAAIWFFIQVIFSSALHFPYVINLVNSILYGTHWYWLALQLLLSAPHQLRWSWKWRNFFMAFHFFLMMQESGVLLPFPELGFTITVEFCVLLLWLLYIMYDW